MSAQLAERQAKRPDPSAGSDRRRKALEALSRLKWWPDEREEPQRDAVAANVDRRLSERGVAVIATDLTGTVRHWNLGAEQLYGWSQAEVLGQPITMLTAGQEDRQIAEDILDGVRQTGSWEGEFPVRRKDGTSFRAHVHNAILKDEDGRPIGILGISVDASRDERTAFPD